MTIRILLADDHSVVREGLRYILDREAGLVVVGEAGDGRQAIELAEALRPDVVVMDITMPECNGVEAARAMLRGPHPPAVVMLTMHNDRHYLREALEAGALGYVAKSAAPHELARAVRAVAAGQRYLSAGAEQLLAQFEHEPADRTARLTARELEVLRLIAEGHNTRQIAEQLFVSVKTIETHRRNIMGKLEIYTVAELTRYALRHGLAAD